MCGIVGFLGDKIQAKFLVEKLKKLEYRGYDSAGIANLEYGKFDVRKAVGKIANLEEQISDDFEINCAIAHTRWATHGKPSKDNAHPHVSVDKSWAVVHNGIIENYLDIKNQLNRKEEIKSETDTAVVAELLAQSNVKSVHDFISVCKQLVGSFALACLNSKLNNKIFLARRKSPLYVAFKNGQSLIASDPICFCNFSDEYFVMNNDEFAVVETDGVCFFNQKGEKIEKFTTKLDEIFEESGKGEYPHFMLKEIQEEKSGLRRIVKSYTDNNVLNKFDKEFLEKYDAVEFIACGTAYHAGLMGARYIEKCVKIKSYATIASEFIYMNPIINPKTLYVFVSQSGETADTLRAMELVKAQNCTTIAVTNVLYSTLAKSVDFVLPVCAGPEIAVASTKAYVCQLAVLYMFARHIQNKLQNENVDYLSDIKIVEENIFNFDDSCLEEIADELKNQTNSIYIGKDLDYITATEGCLKLKEIAYIFASSYPSGELKHGFLALIEEGTIMFVLANSKEINTKTYNAGHEAVSRGARAVLIGGNEDAEILKPTWHIKMPNINELLLPMISVVPLQKIAYLVSVKKGINPDQPRNLAKSVTVE